MLEIQKGDPFKIDSNVEDEMDIFIVAENGDFWQADEFFHMTSIVQFRTKNNE